MRIRSIRSSTGSVDYNQPLCSLRTKVQFCRSESGLKTARRLRPKQGGSLNWGAGKQGFSIIGGCLTLAVISVGISLASLMYKISVHTAVQIEMDRCTGQYAIQLRSAILAMEESFKRLRIAKVAYESACLVPGGCPPATEAAKAYLPIERTIQTAIEVYWKSEQFSWIDPLFLSCKVPYLVMRSGFPKFPYQIISGTLLDFAGPIRSNPTQTNFNLNLKHKNLVSTAEVNKNGSNKWAVRWKE